MKTFALIALGFALLTGGAASDRTSSSPVSRATMVGARAAAQDSETETVLSTMRCRPGKEDELQATLAQEWATLRKLSLVLAAPHVLLKGKDDSGKPIFVEVLTWRDHDAPDHVPPEVQTIWNHLQALVEARDGHKGIEFPEFEIVTSTP
jgi:hypothetical protein